MKAEEAQEKVIEAHKKELEGLLSLIKIKSESGESSWSKFGFISDYSETELKKLGYEVKKWRDGYWDEPYTPPGFISMLATPVGSFDPMTTISWKKV